MVLPSVIVTTELPLIEGTRTDAFAPTGMVAESE
jgi:hypothetical protein